MSSYDFERLKRNEHSEISLLAGLRPAQIFSERRLGMLKTKAWLIYIAAGSFEHETGSTFWPNFLKLCLGILKTKSTKLKWHWNEDGSELNPQCSKLPAANIRYISQAFVFYIYTSHLSENILAGLKPASKFISLRWVRSVFRSQLLITDVYNCKQKLHGRLCIVVDVFGDGNEWLTSIKTHFSNKKNVVGGRVWSETAVIHFCKCPCDQILNHLAKL